LPENGMHRIFLFLSLAALGSCASGDKKAQLSGDTAPGPVTFTSTTALDSGITKMLSAYYSLHDALVEADTTAAAAAARHLVGVADSMEIRSPGIDTLALATLDEFRGDISAEAIGLAGEHSITEQRRAFNMITENLFPLLQAVKFKGHTVYQIECPMAFNDNEAASWLSSSPDVVNPYLGKKHPKYASGMLHCGEVKDSIAYRK
jgi:hypothetical protein